MKVEKFKIIWIEKFPGWKLGKKIKSSQKGRKAKFGLGRGLDLSNLGGEK